MSEQRAIDGNLLAEYIRKIDMPYETKTTVLCTINTMPTIDTVRHGKWEPVYKQDILLPDRMVLNSLKCSECGRTVYTAEPYCHCGAKMGSD